jgi:transcriptional regulator with PAS, ATPase and Fis domain
VTQPLLTSVPPPIDDLEHESTGVRIRRSVDPFLGVSPAIRRLEKLVRSVLASNSPVLILGETGSGKSVLASFIHEHGPRRRGEFVDLNCASLAMELLESELFGHERGAFTGANGIKPGLIELAHGGTLFLDEIGDMDLRIQPKLLKVVEEQRFRRLGDLKYRLVDVRVIAATHQDLAASVRDKQFRSDLYYRISALPLRVPPLRERHEDIPLLATEFLRRRSRSNGQVAPQLSEDALRALSAHHWPGNIRELNNVLERALLCRHRGVITREDLSLDLVSDSSPIPAAADLTLEEVKRRHIAAVLREEGDRVDRAAARLGVPKSTLYQKIRRLGIQREKA